MHEVNFSSVGEKFILFPDLYTALEKHLQDYLGILSTIMAFMCNVLAFFVFLYAWIIYKIKQIANVLTRETQKINFVFMLDPRSRFSEAQMAGLFKSHGNSLMTHLCL